MRLWISHIKNLESLVDDYPMLLDVWADDGVEGPVAEELIDFDRVLTPELIGRLARVDLDHSLTAANGRARIVSWVDAGRAPHDGDPLTTRHLKAVLTAAKDAGIAHADFFNSTNLTEADWTMLSHHAGHEWDPITSPFLSADRLTL